MKCNTHNKLNWKTVVAKLERIDSYETSIPGRRNIVITADGQKYSTLSSFSKVCDVSMDDLTEGDVVEIRYVEKMWRGRMYKNFGRLVVKSKALNAEDVLNKSCLSDEDYADVLRTVEV